MERIVKLAEKNTETLIHESKRLTEKKMNLFCWSKICAHFSWKLFFFKIVCSLDHMMFTRKKLLNPLSKVRRDRSLQSL